MAIDFQNLKFNLNKTRPVGYKYPAGLSFGPMDFVDVSVETINDSTNFVTAVNESTPAPAPSGPNGLEHTAGTANTSMQWNSSGTFIPKFTGEVEVLVVAGGGGGGHGGGGAGGLTYASNQPVIEGTEYNCLVGAGGSYTTTYWAPPAGGYHPSGNQVGPNGWDRVGSPSNVAGFPIVTTGGGGGARPVSTSGDNSTYSRNVGHPGGSGGGGARGYYTWSGTPATNNGPGGSGVAGQGNAGGVARNPSSGPPGVTTQGVAGGGGGAGGVGEAGRSDNVGAAGGDGLEYSISGSPLYYAGGGGGGGYWATAGWAVPDTMTSTEGAGGQGGGGDGGYGALSGSPGGTPAYPYVEPIVPVAGVSGTANRGGGGGGRLDGSISSTGGAGGSGVIIIRFKTYQRLDDNYFID